MNPTKPPLVTLVLIAGSIATAFAQVWYPGVIDLFGFHTGHPSVYTALTSLFLHANTMHLLGNMVFLAAVGPAVEANLGSWRLALAYFAGGLAGVAVHWILAGRASFDAPLVGASGAIAACVALFSIRFYAVRVPLAPRWKAPIIGVTGAWLGMQVLGAFVDIGRIEGGMAYWAHIGGFAGGLLLSVAFRSAQAASIEQAQATINAMIERSPAATLSATEESLRKHPKDLRLMRQRAEALRQLGESAQESQALVELFEASPPSDQPNLLRRLGEIAGLGGLDVRTRSRLAQQLQSSAPDVSAMLLESVVADTQDSPELPVTLLSLAEVQKESSPDRAQELVRQIFERFPMHPAADLARAKGWKS